MSVSHSTEAEWAERYYPAAVVLLEEILPQQVVHMRRATELEDMRQATDAVFEINHRTHVALRMRRRDCGHRDFTIRTLTQSGYPSELPKLRSGFGDWYLYAWVDEHDVTYLPEWWLIDLDRVRAGGLLDIDRTETPNRDGSGFVAVARHELVSVGALVLTHKSPRQRGLW